MTGTKLAVDAYGRGPFDIPEDVLAISAIVEAQIYFHPAI